jgi:hypothetical protein
LEMSSVRCDNKAKAVANGHDHKGCGDSCGTKRPFLIGVAGGTASGKVRSDLIILNDVDIKPSG